MDVMRGELKMPPALARVRVECDHRTTEKVITFAHLAIEIRPRIADAPIQGVRLGIICAGHPGGRPAAAPAIPLPGIVAELAWTGNRIEAPQAFPRHRIVGIDKAADSKLGAGDAGDDLVPQRQWGHRTAEALQMIGHLGFPEWEAAFRVKR